LKEGGYKILNGLKIVCRNLGHLRKPVNFIQQNCSSHIKPLSKQTRRYFTESFLFLFYICTLGSLCHQASFPVSRTVPEVISIVEVTFIERLTFVLFDWLLFHVQIMRSDAFVLCSFLLLEIVVLPYHSTCLYKRDAKGNLLGQRPRHLR